jgi:hypothetical protein
MIRLERSSSDKYVQKAKAVQWFDRLTMSGSKFRSSWDQRRCAEPGLGKVEKNSNR